MDIVAPMQVSASTEAPGATDADTIAVGVFGDSDGRAQAPAGVPAEVA